jgi:hypothetical protein
MTLVDKARAVGKTLGTSYIVSVKRKSEKKIKPLKTIDSNWLLIL